MQTAQNQTPAVPESPAGHLPLTDKTLGMGQGIWRTFQACIRHPLDVFSQPGYDRSMSRFFLYAFCMRIAAVILALEVRWMVAGIPMTAFLLGGAVVDILLELFLLPVFVYIGLRTIGTGGIRFRETFNIISLTKTAAILIPVPLIGWQLYTIVMLLWSIPALTRGHRITLWRSVLAVLFPVVLIVAVLSAVLFLNGLR